MVIFPTQVFMCPFFSSHEDQIGKDTALRICMFMVPVVLTIYCTRLILLFWPIAKLQIGKFGRHYIHMFFCFLFVCRHTFKILILPWPLKMLSFNFSNILDWTGLDLTTDFQCSSRSEIGQQLFLKSSV